MKNIGSILSIIIHEIDKNQTDLPSNSTVSPNLNGISVINSTSIYFTQETAELNSVEKSSPNGPYFEIKLALKIPKVTFTSFFENLNIKFYIIEIKDANGNSFVMGNCANPVLITRNLKIPSKTSGYNGRDIVFVSRQKHDLIYIG